MSASPGTERVFALPRTALRSALERAGVVAPRETSAAAGSADGHGGSAHPVDPPRDLPQGFVALTRPALQRLETELEAAGDWHVRSRAESDTSLKQPIPYCAIRHGDAVFVAERLGAHGEKRLHGRGSLGFGGHVGPEDGPRSGCLRRALKRELEEELRLPDGWPDPVPLGFINDDATPVGQVHFGLAYLVDLDPTRPDLRDTVAVREILKLTGGFRGLVGAPAVWQDAPNLESWSDMLLSAIQPL